MAFDSLYTGISGLDAYQSWIDMISNNIANTATVGFKAQRMTFADQFYQQTGSPSGPTSTSGGVNPIDNGLGVKVNTVDTEFGQGGLETTGINTDLALNGNGFFILNNANGTGSATYTRDGAFSQNSNGLFYDPASGLAVMGYMANSAGVVTPGGTPGAITIPVGKNKRRRRVRASRSGLRRTMTSLTSRSAAISIKPTGRKRSKTLSAHRQIRVRPLPFRRRCTTRSVARTKRPSPTRRSRQAQSRPR
jgi:flagellar hook-basal body protein